MFHSRMAILRRLVQATLVATLALLSSSCGSKAGFHPVTGKVIYKGEPAIGADVTLHLEGNKDVNTPLPFGMVGDDGTFSLKCKDIEGAPAGKYYVFIRWMEDREGLAKVTKKKLKRDKAVPDDFFKGKYQDHKNPKYRVEIKAGKNTLEPFEVD